MRLTEKGKQKTSEKSVVGYIRVSHEEQAREGHSLSNQRAKIEAYCALNDIELVE